MGFTDAYDRSPFTILVVFNFGNLPRFIHVSDSAFSHWKTKVCVCSCCYLTLSAKQRNFDVLVLVNEVDKLMTYKYVNYFDQFVVSLNTVIHSSNILSLRSIFGNDIILKCFDEGDFNDVHNVFDKMPHRIFFRWNVLIGEARCMDLADLSRCQLRITNFEFRS